jgi:hypothetical protein
MGQPVTDRTVAPPDERFAVETISTYGSAYYRSGFLTLAEAEQGVEEFRQIMVACGAFFVRPVAELPDIDLQAILRAPRPLL